jgi:nucleotide-binding universal stress UspA family protein
MPDLRTILVPVDFSARAIAVAEHAVAMASRLDSKLLFAHVVHRSPFEYGTFASGHFDRDILESEAVRIEECNRQMNALVERVSSGRPIEVLLPHGDPAGAIEELVTSRRADLVMMPTHGYGPFRRFLLGSVTAKVLHDVRCPVFTGVHIPEVWKFNTEPYKRVACALDLEEHSEAVLRWASEFAAAWEADFIVIHAAPPPRVNLAYGEFMVAEPSGQLIQAAEEEIDRLVSRLGCEAEVHVASAEAVDHVRATIERTYADLLVIGRSAGHNPLGRLWGHAYALIRESPCPVISV